MPSGLACDELIINEYLFSDKTEQVLIIYYYTSRYNAHVCSDRYLSVSYPEEYGR